jgi:3-isopropylmalate dehydratase small subunit
MAKVVLKVDNDISTDVIYPGRYMATVLPTETPQFCFADLKEFNKKLTSGEVPKGSIVVAGSNFGCGSSREQAVSTLVGHDLVVVARSFARIFLQNAVNLGLKMVTAPEIEASEGDELVIERDAVVNKATGKRQAIIDAGGLIPYTRQIVVKERAAVHA